MRLAALSFLLLAATACGAQVTASRWPVAPCVHDRVLSSFAPPEHAAGPIQLPEVPR